MLNECPIRSVATSRLCLPVRVYHSLPTPHACGWSGRMWLKAVDKRDKSPRGKLILVTSSRTLRVGRVWRFRKHGVKLPFGIGIPNVVL